MKRLLRYWKAGCILLVVLVLGGYVLKSNAYEVANMVSAVPNLGASTKELNWYFKPNDENKPPERTPECDLIEKYDGYYLGSPDEKVIYLTFDAGYENGYTVKILDTLKKHNAVGAFFLVEHYLNSSPELVKRMVDEGHLVCNHTANHKNLARLTNFEDFKREITRMEDKFREITGKELPKYLRPPEGTYSELALQYAQKLGYSTIFWSFAYADWDNDNQPSPESALSKIYPRTHNGEVALLHSTSKTNAEILDEVLTKLEQEGYTFQNLDHLTQNTARQ